jgi:outer membrane protein assembly factor BamB
VRFTLCYLLLGAGIVANGADWTQWRGPNRDGAAIGARLPSTWPKSLKQLWEVKVGKGCSSPVVIGDRIYIHDRREPDEIVSCLNLADGKTLWSGRYAAPWTIQPGAGDDKGPHSTPTVKDGRVFTLGINGVLTCWDAANGDVKWRWQPPDGATHAIPSYGAALSPLVDGNLVYAHGNGEAPTAIAAFDIQTGQMKWAWHGAMPAYASPILVEMAGQRQLILLTESNLAGLSPIDGKVLWTRKMRPRNSYENIITPIQYKDLLIYSQTGYPEIMAIRLLREGDAIKTEDVWTNRDHRLSDCTPIVVGNLLIGLSHGKVGHLFCLDAATGQNLWEYGNGLQSEVPLINLGTFVLAVTKGIRLHVFRPNAERFDPVAEWQGPVASMVASPVFLDDRILLWDSSGLRMMAVADAR